MKEYDISSFITETDFYGQPVFMRDAVSGGKIFPHMIWAMGDSHTQYLEDISTVSRPGAAVLPHLVFRHIFSNESPTAWKLVEEGSNSLGRERLFSALRLLKPSQEMLLCYGEIDARAHLPRKYQQGIPLEKCVADTVGRYAQVLKEMERFRGRVYVHGLPPISSIMLKEGPLTDPRAMQVSEEVRIQAFVLLNDGLKSACAELGYKFFDAMRHTSEKGRMGVMDDKWLKDTHHLKPEASGFFIKWYMGVR